MVNPPPIGEALTVGWEKFKENPVPLVLGVLIGGLLVSALPLIGLGLGMPGILYMGLKAARGQTPEIGDVFIGFQKPLDNIMIGLLQQLGLLACCIGVLVTAPLFYMGYFLILEQGMTWQQAKDVCLERVKPNWLGWAIFYLVLTIVGQLGAIACVVGVLVTVPITVVAFAYAYERTLASRGASA